MLYAVGTHIDFTKPAAPIKRLDTTGLYEPGTEFKFVPRLSAEHILRIGRTLNLILV